MSERLDPDMAEAMAFEAARDAALPPPLDLDEERARGRAAAAFWNEGLPEMAAIEDHLCTGPGGPVPLRVFKPHATGPLPVVLYIHGGGWAVGSVVQNEPLIRTLAARAGWAIAETGAAGPTGNPYGDAAGHTVVAISGPVERARTIETGSSDRRANMDAFARAALELLDEALGRGQ